MLVDVSNLTVILGVMVAFLIGVSGVYLCYAISTHFKSKNRTSDTMYSDRLKYYEGQLIDMKIRLDSMSVHAAGLKPPEPPQRHMPFEGDLGHESYAPKGENKRQAKPRPVEDDTVGTTPKPTNQQHTNSTDQVLHLITNNPMTSRDIQAMLKKSREHTSRLMKKLYVDGYVERHTESKPYTYSITEKGVARIKA